MEERRPKRLRQPSLNYAQPAQPEESVDVTVFTQIALFKSPHPKVYEDPRHFDQAELGELTSHVKAYRSRRPDDLVIIIAEVTGPTSTPVATGKGIGEPYADLKTRLYDLAGGRFPKHIINSVVNKRPRQPYAPGEGGAVRGNAAWVLKYRGGSGVFPGSTKPSSQDPIGLLAQKTWIGAWVGRRETEKTDKRTRPPMAVIIFHQDQRPRSYDRHCDHAMMMIDQYKATPYRWRCVREQPLFLFMDLDRLFNDFEANVAKTYREVNEVMEPESYSRRHKVIFRVARLRKTLVQLAKFRQELKTHEIAQKSIEKIVQLRNVPSDHPGQSSRLGDRLYDLGNELETLNLQVDMLREQCIYIMDSEFNIVAARTDARLGILTVLAFILTPAGFVVSVFSVIDAGTTQLVISTVLVAFFSVAVFVIVDRLYRVAEGKPLLGALAAWKEDHNNGVEKLTATPLINL